MAKLLRIISVPPNTHSPVWNILTISLLAVAALLYLHGFPGLLPYYLDPDEPVFYISTAEIRTTGHVQLNPIYPPLRFYEMVAEQLLVDVVSYGQATPTVYAIFSRASSAYFALLLLAVIYRISRKLHSSLAGLFAVAWLTIDSQIVAFSHVARGDTLSWLLSASAILATLNLLRHETKTGWVTLILFSLGAFLAKYSAAPIWLLPAYLSLKKLFPKPASRWSLVGLAIAMSAASLWYVRANSGAWSYLFTHSGFGFLLNQNLGSQANLLNSISKVRTGMGDEWLIVGLALLPMLTIWGRLRFTISSLTLLSLLAGVVAGTALVFTLTIARYHDAYIVVLIWAVFSGLALGLLAERGRWLGLAIALGITAFVGWPRLINAWEFGEGRTRPQSLAALGDWFIANVPQGARTVVERHTPFNSYAGFPGRQIYHQFVVDSIFAESVDEYRKRGYEYLIWISKEANDSALADLATPRKQQLLQGTTEALRLAGDAYLGKRVVVYQIPPLQQHPLYLWFGDAISFRGFDLESETLSPGGQLKLTLYWMSAKKTPANYIIFVHVLAADGKTLLVGQDGPPDHGNRPTWAWVGDMEFITDQHLLNLPPDAPAGTYTLRIGMYDADTSRRLQVFDLQHQPVGDNVVLAEIRIQK